MKRNEHYQRQVIDAGGLEAVAACLRHHPDDPDVFDDATSALQALWPSRGPPSLAWERAANGNNQNSNNAVVVVEPF